MPALARTEKIAPAVLPKTGASVVALPGRPAAKSNARKIALAVSRNVVPPLIVLAVILVIWQVLCSEAGATLPPPSQVWQESYDLIAYPFFNYGSQDIGLGWRVLISLQRVAYRLRPCRRHRRLVGALIGQSVWAMRGLDPIFQVLRTVPPLAWLPLSLAAFQDESLGDLRDLHHLDLAGDHQHGRRRPQHPAGLPQRRQGAAAEPDRVLLQDHAAIGRTLHLHRPSHRRRPVWLAIVAAEMLTGGVGIGFFIWDAWNSSRLPDIIVALAYIGVVGFILDKLVAAVGHRHPRRVAN
jgi:nitrate/nitrite transport system permease protein